MTECKEFQMFFEMNFEKTSNLDTPSISKTWFEAILEANQWKVINNQIKDQLKSLRIPFKYNKDLRMNGQKGLWYRFSKITTPQDENEDIACLF
jgi:extradiol dioxygenase family protein